MSYQRRFEISTHRRCQYPGQSASRSADARASSGASLFWLGPKQRLPHYSTPGGPGFTRSMQPSPPKFQTEINPTELSSWLSQAEEHAVLVGQCRPIVDNPDTLCTRNACFSVFKREFPSQSFCGSLSLQSLKKPLKRITARILPNLLQFRTVYLY